MSDVVNRGARARAIKSHAHVVTQLQNTRTHAHKRTYARIQLTMPAATLHRDNALCRVATTPNGMNQTYALAFIIISLKRMHMRQHPARLNAGDYSTRNVNALS